jgi:2'-5' RNA ligase
LRAAVTGALTQQLTKEMVEQMISRSLTRQAAERLLAMYESQLAQGGMKAANQQFVPRITLMKKILELWPKKSFWERLFGW